MRDIDCDTASGYACVAGACVRGLSGDAGLGDGGAGADAGLAIGDGGPGPDGSVIGTHGGPFGTDAGGADAQMPVDISPNTISGSIHMHQEVFTPSGAQGSVNGGTVLMGRSATNILTITFNGTAPGTFSCASGGVSVQLQDQSQSSLYRAGAPPGTYSTPIGTCTIVVTEYGGVGMPINGTFDASLLPVTGGTPGARVSISGGGFSVTRTQ